VSEFYLVTVFKIGHRIFRDKRITTHLALVSRAFGAKEIIIAGERDDKIINTVNKVVLEWGGDFRIKFIPYDDWKICIEEWKASHAIIVHLTMYGKNLKYFRDTTDFNQLKSSSTKLNNIVVIVGGEKVPGKVFRQVDWNIAITNQPHSEVGSLAVFLNHLITDSLDLEFPNSIRKIQPSLKGKKGYLEDIDRFETE
jgi:tRNA (cytidine56-2'-O)-methyltransferase